MGTGNGELVIPRAVWFTFGLKGLFPSTIRDELMEGYD